jgi:hypothetical protein
MANSDAAFGVWCILGIIAVILSIFISQFIANYFAFTGMMWWVVAVIAYLIVGTVLGAIVWLITLSIS